MEGRDQSEETIFKENPEIYYSVCIQKGKNKDKHE